jgi:MSHA pilin protein MshC
MIAAKQLRKPPCPRHGVTQSRGFTLIELIMVIIIMGVLAVVAAPRIINTGDFYARGFHDETLSYLRFAQKTAIAQRRTVCVTFSTNSLTLTIASATASFNCTTAGALIGPKGETTVTLSAKSTVAFASLPSPPSDFNFDGQGQPITSLGAAMATQTFQVSGASNSITVETVTGYVHE